MISFIIPVFNGERFLRECIDSLLVQEEVEVEIIAVDDGSFDNSRTILDSYGSRLRTLSTPNLGVSVARNVGLGDSRGQFIVFIDQDDCVVPAYARHMRDALLSHPEACAVYCEAGVTVENGATWLIESGDFTGRMYTGLLNGKCFVSPGAVMIRRYSIEATGGFDPVLSSKGEDLDLWLKMARFFPWTYVPQPLFWWRKHSENNSNKIVAMYLGVRHVLDRHMILNRPHELSETDISRAIRHSRKAAAAHLRRSVKEDINNGTPPVEALQKTIRELAKAPDLTVEFLKVPLSRRR